MNIVADTSFKYVINSFDMFIPIFFTGVIASSMLVYLILFLKVKKINYLYILIFFLFFVIYNLFHIIAIAYGAVMDELTTALQANRISIVSLMFMFIFISLYNFLDLIQNRKKRKYLYWINLLLFIITAVFLLSLITIYFIKPNLFISVTEYSVLASEKIYQYARSFGHSYFLYKVFRYYILFFIGVNALFIMIKIATDKILSKFDIISLVFTLLSFLFLYESISFNFIIFPATNFNRMALSIFLLVMPYSLILFDSFLEDAIKSIKKQDISSNDAIANFDKIKNVKNKPEEIYKLSIDIKKKGDVITEILKESREALDITENKIKNLDLLSNTSTIDEICKKSGDLSRSIENIFDTFGNTRVQIEERCKFLFNLIEDSEKLANSNTNIQDVVKNLINTSKNLETESDIIFKKIYKAIYDLSDFNNITHTINDTISSIKDITIKTNLLSINASIQASKAGIIGKSFSIVAKEIGSIAFENSKLTEQIEKILKNIFDSVISIDISNKNIKIECELLEDYIKTMKNNIDKLILSLEEYINMSIEGKKVLKEINIQGLSIDNTKKQQDSLVIAVHKNVNTFVELEKEVYKNIARQKESVTDILNKINTISDIKTSMEEYRLKIEENIETISEKSAQINNSFKRYREL